MTVRDPKDEIMNQQLAGINNIFKGNTLLLNLIEIEKVSNTIIPDKHDIWTEGARTILEGLLVYALLSGKVEKEELRGILNASLYNKRRYLMSAGEKGKQALQYLNYCESPLAAMGFNCTLLKYSSSLEL